MFLHGTGLADDTSLRRGLSLKHRTQSKWCLGNIAKLCGAIWLCALLLDRGCDFVMFSLRNEVFHVFQFMLRNGRTSYYPGQKYDLWKTVWNLVEPHSSLERTVLNIAYWTYQRFGSCWRRAWFFRYKGLPATIGLLLIRYLGDFHEIQTVAIREPKFVTCGLIDTTWTFDFNTGFHRSLIYEIGISFF